MRARSLVSLGLVWLVVCAAGGAARAQVTALGDLPDPRPGLVVDKAGVLDDAAEQSLNAQLAALRREVGPEVAVVAVPDVSGTPKAFATALFNRWQLGTAERNDGVLVLLVVKQRRLEIETGDGMQALLSAAWLSAMQRDEMIPYFKRGDLGGGLVVGADALVKRLRTPPGEQDAPDAAGAYRSDGALSPPPGPSEATGATGATGASGTSGATSPSSSSPSPSQPDASAASAPEEPSRGLQLLAGLGAVGGVGGLGVFAVRRRSRKCKKCGALRQVLDEEADDAHLSEGQRAEEKVGSVDHIILYCAACEAFEHRSSNRFFSRRIACTGCKNRTAINQTRVLRAPTYSSSGLAEVTTTCAFCPHTATSRHSLAKLTPPSSSSSSSSSSSRSSYSSSSSSSSRSSSSSSSSKSSGGGRSSGGGAGSSW